MIIVNEVNKVDESNNTMQVSLFADTKSEIQPNMNIEQIEGYTLAFGSSVMTASGELAFLKSDGTWNWV